MTAWITGAHGFIGRYLVRELADRGETVHGVGHGAFDEPDRCRLGLRTWFNGEIDAANLNALAASRARAIRTVFWPTTLSCAAPDSNGGFRWSRGSRTT